MFAEIESLLGLLRSNGVELWAVSSTNKWVVSEGVRALGIPEDRVLAAEVSVNQGIIGSDLVDVPTDEGKATALKRVGLARPDAVFGNSIHDLAMLEIARECFPGEPLPSSAGGRGEKWMGLLPPGTAEGVEAAVAGE